MNRFNKPLMALAALVLFSSPALSASHSRSAGSGSMTNSAAAPAAPDAATTAVTGTMKMDAAQPAAPSNAMAPTSGSMATGVAAAGATMAQPDAMKVKKPRGSN